MQIGEVITTDEEENFLVTSVIWLGVKTTTKEPYNPSVNGHKVRPNYQSRIGESALGSVIIGESINEYNEIEYFLGDNSYFDAVNENDPLFSHLISVGEEDL